MKGLGFISGGVATFLALGLWAQPASAQSDAARAAARDLGADGVEAYQAGNYVVATEKLGRAFEILRAPSLGLWSARALAKSGKLVEASERYVVVTRLDVTGDVAVQNQAKADAATEREALLPKIPSLTIDAKGASADAVYTLDGAPLSRALLNVRQPANPGRHVLSVRDGNKLLEREVTLTEGQRLTASLDLADAKLAPATSAPSADSTASPGAAQSPAVAATDTPPAADKPGLPAGFWVGVGVAGVGLAVGGVTAGLAAQKRSDLGCNGTLCDASKADGVNSYNSLLTVSTIGFVAAGVGAATAGVFLLTRPKPAQQARYISPFVGVGSAGVVGAF